MCPVCRVEACESVVDPGGCSCGAISEICCTTTTPSEAAGLSEASWQIFSIVCLHIIRKFLYFGPRNLLRIVYISQGGSAQFQGQDKLFRRFSKISSCVSLYRCGNLVCNYISSGERVMSPPQPPPFFVGDSPEV